jgi:hypothetical protein
MISDRIALQDLTIENKCLTKCFMTVHGHKILCTNFITTSSKLSMGEYKNRYMKGKLLFLAALLLHFN